MKANEKKPAEVIAQLEKWANGDTCGDCPARDDTVFQAIELLREAYLEESGPRTYIVTEWCPHCEEEIEMCWNTDVRGFKAFCPACGQRLMLCDECQHMGGYTCDYDSATDSCRFNPARSRKPMRKLWARLGVMLSITDDEAEVILGDDWEAGTEALRGVIKAGRFQADGNSYIPESCVEDYNKAYGADFEPGDDVEFDL